MQQAELCHSSVVEVKQKYHGAENNAGDDDSCPCNATLSFLNMDSFFFFKQMLNFADANCQAGSLGGLAKGLEREDAVRLPGRDCTFSTAMAALGGCCWES